MKNELFKKNYATQNSIFRTLLKASADNVSFQLFLSNLTLSRGMTCRVIKKSHSFRFFTVIHLFRNARETPFRSENRKKICDDRFIPLSIDIISPSVPFLPPTALIIILKYAQTASSSSRNPTLACSPHVPTESFFPKICSILSRSSLSLSFLRVSLSCVHTYAPGVAYAWLESAPQKKKALARIVTDEIRSTTNLDGR